MKKLFYILLFILTFLFYWSTAGGICNRTAAEDAYEYAMMVEQGDAHPWFYHRHHLLYGPLMRGLFRGAQWIGYDGRAIGTMRLVSAAAAAATLFFFFLFCYRRFSLRPVSSLIATLLLGATYGFWRYSAESEIPVMASALMVASLYYATNRENRLSDFAFCIFFSSFAVLIHVMNGIAVFFAIPCWYLLGKRWMQAGLHLILCGSVVFGMYLIIGVVYPFEGSGTALQPVALGSFVKAGVAFVECVVSCDFMLGFRSVRAFLGELFAERMLLEEFYYGERLSRVHVLLSSLTFLSFWLLASACVLRAGWVWEKNMLDRGRMHLPEGISSVVVAALFFCGFGALLLFIEPGNPELWIMGLPPFALVFCGLVLLPLTVDNRLWLPFAAVLVLLLHNAGAIYMLHDASKDYQQAKADGILDIAKPGDLIVTAGNPVFERYLRYHTDAEILYLYTLTEEELAVAQIPAVQGTVYLLGDVFGPPKSLAVRFPVRTAWIQRFAGQTECRVELILQDDFGGVYQLEEASEQFR